MRRYLVERDVPGAGKFDMQRLREAAENSNRAVARLAPDLQWLHGYVIDDATVCVYLANDEQSIRRHGEMTGYPVSRIREIRNVFDPSTSSVRVGGVSGGAR